MRSSSQRSTSEPVAAGTYATRVDAQRARELGMVNRLVPREQLDTETDEGAEKIAAMPRLGLSLTKRAVNQAEDLTGLHSGLDSAFGLHHLAHAHNARSMRG